MRIGQDLFPECQLLFSQIAYTGCIIIPDYGCLRTIFPIITAIAESYAHLYRSALKEHVPLYYEGLGEVLSEADYDTIMDFLSERDFPMLISEIEDSECETLNDCSSFQRHLPDQLCHIL